MVVQCALDKPRVISELRKTTYSKRILTPSNSLEDSNRPKISGELLWSATPTQWHVKYAEVRHGSLFVYCSDTGVAEFRLPLHHLNLLATNTPRTFTLTAGHGIPLATFQTLTEAEYNRWVTVLAVEVLRQTPLQDVRFLDIIGITRVDSGLRRGRSEECLTSTSRLWVTTPEPVVQTKPNRNKYNFREDCAKKKKERTEFSQWLHCVKRENDEENKTKNDFDMKNVRIRRASRIRPKLPFAETWKQVRDKQEPRYKSLSMENLQIRDDPVQIEPRQCTCIEEKKEVISDESGISSGDENNNTLTDSSTKSGNNLQEESNYVSVREKKKFFESLSSDGQPKKTEVSLNRSNSINVIDKAPPTATLQRSQRASSMYDLSGNNIAVKEMRRKFESTPEEITKSCEALVLSEENKSGSVKRHKEVTRTLDVTKSLDDIVENSGSERSSPVLVQPIERQVKDTVNYANIQFVRPVTTVKIVSKTDVSASEVSETESTVSNQTEPSASSALLIQRKLQRGERKLTKLRIQIAEVEETIKIIAEDLHSIEPDTLKRRKGLEVFAALRRRLEEETSRLERLQEETSKVIRENQRTILKMGSTRGNRS